VTNNGTAVKQGTGTWTIDRALDAPLGTDILAGTLVVDAILTTVQVNVTPGGVLQLNSGGSRGEIWSTMAHSLFAGSGTVTFDAGDQRNGQRVSERPRDNDSERPEQPMAACPDPARSPIAVAVAPLSTWGRC